MNTIAFEASVMDGRIRLPDSAPVHNGEKVHVIVWKDNEASKRQRSPDIFDRHLVAPLKPFKPLRRDDIYTDR